jgi:membrane associated rhomboid family serine protease/Zn-finger nucleic acid-binding protein
MMHCPRDASLLQRTRIAKDATVFACPRCSGRAVAMPVVRRQLSVAAGRELWRRALATQAASGAACPACLQATMAMPLDDAEHASRLELDVCTRCHLVWFDPDEHATLPAVAKPEPPPDDCLTPEQRQRFAIEQVQEMVAAARRAALEEPSLELHRLPALLGLPVELGDRGLAGRPWGTWLLAAAVAISSGIAFSSPSWFDQLALVPADLRRGSLLTLLSVFFVHGSWWHLLGNLWFFVVFGDDVEILLGRARWLGIVVLATVLGSLAEVFADPTSAIPMVGASGGISGLVVCYALLQPHARLGVWVSSGYVMRWFTFSARTGLGLWLALQAWLVWQELAGWSNIAALAHLGGALVGFAAWLAWRDDPR